MRPVSRIRKLVSSIRSAKGPSEPPLKKLRNNERLASNAMYEDSSVDDEEYACFDYVSIAKKAFLKEPSKSCLKTPQSQARNVRVRFEGQKKAWVPKSVLKRKAEAKQKALEGANEKALVTVSPKDSSIKAVPPAPKYALCSAQHAMNDEPSPKKGFKSTLPQKRARSSDNYDVVPNTSCTVEEIGNEVSSDEARNDTFSGPTRNRVPQNNNLKNVLKRMGIYESYAYMFASSEDQEEDEGACNLSSFDEIPSSCSETDCEVSDCISSDHDDIETQFFAMKEEISRLVDIQ